MTHDKPQHDYAQAPPFDWDLVVAQLPAVLARLPDDTHRRKVAEDLIEHLHRQSARLAQIEQQIATALAAALRAPGEA